MKSLYMVLLGGIFGLGCFQNARIQASTVVEFFNNYGGTANLNSKGSAANGWLTGWDGSSLPKYQSGSQLDYNAPWFSDAGNEFDASNDGLAHSGAPGEFHLPNPDGVDPNSVALRSFDALTGTVWISAVTIVDTGFPIIGDGHGTILWLEPNASGVGGNNYIALRSDVGSATGQPEPVVQYAGTVDDSNNTVVRRGPPTLLLARIEIDAAGTPNDTLTFWVNPTLTGNEADLEPQALYRKSGSDIVGPSFDSIGISFAAGLNLIDSIRVSSSSVGVGLVVPEPSTAALACVNCLLGLIFVRRRRTRYGQSSTKDQLRSA